MHFRTYHDRGIADTIWKRARWARQARRSFTFGGGVQKVKHPERHVSIVRAAAQAVRKFLAAKIPERRFNR